MEIKSGVRSQKSAKLKLAILSATTRLIGERSFKELHISELCEAVNISKVTLFKYFPQKEDILLYYMRVWALHRTVELSINGKTGVSGIHHLVDKLSETFERHPGLVLSYVGHMANIQIIQKPFTVKEAERKILYPDLENIKSIEIKSLEQMLETFLLEAIFNREITGSSNTQDLTYMVVSVIYGAVLTAHIHRIKPTKLYFRRNIETVLKGMS